MQWEKNKPSSSTLANNKKNNDFPTLNLITLLAAWL